MSNPERQFSFSEVTLYKDQALGVGSYGSVCKAKCDTLTCAAKIIHSVLFDLADPGVGTMMRRFEQECQLLSAIKHPNIVQYLGTHTDKDTGLPVLLMELMDHNLTHYLDTSTLPLPLHIQINFSLDIATALAYLHFNTILHRDLSSNNVLLLAERRAKITDFGMSQLERVNSRMTPAAQCPGMVVYMPPEALEERPHHTDKLDIFSFGVLLVQILTLKFPEPSDRFTSLQVPDPRNKKQMIEVQAPIKEVDRRQNHISLVEDSPLLNISLACLEDKHEDRPPASLLCAQLEELKLLDAYRRSAEVNYKTEYHKIKEEFDQKETYEEACIGDIKDRLLKTEEEMEVLKCLVHDKDYVIQEKVHLMKARETNSLRWRRTRDAPVKFYHVGHTAVVGNMAYFLQITGDLLGSVENKIYQYDTETESWDTLPHPPVYGGFTIVTIHNLFLTTIGGYDNKEGKLYTYVSRNEGEKWVQKFPPINSPRLAPLATSTHDSVIVIARSSKDYIKGSVLDLQILQWTHFKLNHFFHTSFFKKASSFVLQSASLFVNDDTLYCVGGGGQNSLSRIRIGVGVSGQSDNGNYLFSCPLSQIQDETRWKRLHLLPSTGQAVTCFKGHILGIGGGCYFHHQKMRITGRHSPRFNQVHRSQDIHRYDPNSDTWVKLCEMEVARAHCMVAVVGNEMIVVGNDSSDERTSITHIATIA